MPIRPLMQQATSVDPDLVEACGESPRYLCEQAFELTGGNEVAARTVDWLVGRPLTILIIAVVAWILTRVVRRHLEGFVQRIMAPDREATARRLSRVGIDDPGVVIGAEPDPRREARARSIAGALGSTGIAIIWSIATILIVAEVGVAIGPLVAGAGIAGVALGFGAQNLVKDCIAGLFMLLEDQYGIGDIVDLGEATGEVEEITLRTTVLRGVDGTVWHVPNGEVTRVGNKSQLWSVALVDVDVAYDTDLDAAQQVLLDAANGVVASEEWADLIAEEPTMLGVETLGADGITLRMAVKTAPGTQWALQRRLRHVFRDALESASIEIPFPQRTLWLRTESAGDSAAGGRTTDGDSSPGGDGGP